MTAHRLLPVDGWASRYDEDNRAVFVREFTDPELVPLPASDEFAEFDTTGAEFNAMWNQSSAQNIAINLTPAQQHADEQAAGSDRSAFPYKAEREAAIEVVAQKIARDRVALLDLDWGDYPEIGEYDWIAVVDAVAAAVPDVSYERYEAAYALLSARAQNEEA